MHLGLMAVGIWSCIVPVCDVRLKMHGDLVFKVGDASNTTVLTLILIPNPNWKDQWLTDRSMLEYSFPQMVREHVFILFLVTFPLRW